MQELKPCPFCGGEAELSKYYPGFSRKSYVMVRCRSCRANTGDWRRRDIAVARWNRRIENPRTVTAK